MSASKQMVWSDIVILGLVPLITPAPIMVMPPTETEKTGENNEQ